MSRSSRTRRKKARAKKMISKHHTHHSNRQSNTGVSWVELSDADKRFLVVFGVISVVVTVFYWWLGS